MSGHDMSRRDPPNISNMVSLKVDNLTYRTGSDELRRIFERCGEVGDVYIPRDRHTKESRGFAFVRYFDKRDAEDALKEMDGRMLDGRELRVQMARYGRPASPARGRGGRRDDRGGGGGDRRRGGRSRSRDRRRRSNSNDRYRKSDRDSRSKSRSRDKESRSPPPRKSRSRSKSRSHQRASRSRS